MVTNYGDITPRTAAFAVKEMLSRAEPVTILEKFAQATSLPSNKTKVMKFRRYNALDNSVKVLIEGITPPASVLTITDVTVTLQQYGDRIIITDVIEDTHEDPVLAQSTEVLGEQAGQMMEIMRYGVLCAGTNVYYGNGTARSAVTTPIETSTTNPTNIIMRRVVRALKRQNAKKITKILAAGPNIATAPVNAAYVAIVHPDLEMDIRNLPGFVAVESYPQISPFPSELGKCEEVRYITSTLCAPFPDAGGAAGANLSTSGTYADIYPIHVFGEQAFACTALKGMYAITPTVVNKKPSDSDPMAQRTHVAWKSMQACVILNDLWMCRVEVSCTA
jgi:N4-gp56 family major capsid protein